MGREEVTVRQTRSRQAHEAQRAAVLLAAAVEFGRNGFERATMAAIARGAGLAVGSLYNLFPSKQALHLALLEQRADAILAHGAAVAPPSPGQETPGSWSPADPRRADAAEELTATGAARRAQSLERRRTAILAAARTVFEAEGYYGATMAGIAAAAGMATGSLYTCFGSKDALFHTLVEGKAAEFIAYLHTEVDGRSGAAAQITGLIAAECTYYEANRDFLRIYITARSGFDGGARQELGEAFRREYTAYLGWVADILAAGMAEGALRPMDPQALAQALVGMLNATLFEWMIAPDGTTLCSRAATLAQLFLRGAAV
jgi:AcrR family transcriptional regulator